MNETLKQRIVGAAVITAIAAIFIPMLFDDPVSDENLYSNELSLPQAPENNMQEVLDDIPKSASEVLSQPIPAQVNLQSKKIQKSIKETPMHGWIIQIGSFSLEKNANEFRDKLRKNQFTAYVDSITTDKHGTLYRLRVGPELDEKRALKTQELIESRYKIKTIMVSE